MCRPAARRGHRDGSEGHPGGTSSRPGQAPPPSVAAASLAPAGAAVAMETAGQAGPRVGGSAGGLLAPGTQLLMAFPGVRLRGGGEATPPADAEVASAVQVGGGALLRRGKAV